jgi:hypothetical protein
MNSKRIFLALVVAFVAISATDYLIHEVWLKSTYAADAGKLWRSEEDMKDHMSGIFLGQFFAAVAFTMLWARIAMGGAGLQCAVALGFFLGLFYSGGVIITHAVQPLPHGLALKWIISGMLQSILVGVILFFVYRPAKACPPVS